MAIELDTPVVIEPVAEKTYPLVWLGNFMANGTPTTGVRITAEINPAREVNGVLELAPKNKAIKVIIPDFFSVATPEDYATMYALINLLLVKSKLPQPVVAAPEQPETNE